MNTSAVKCRLAAVVGVSGVTQCSAVHDYITWQHPHYCFNFFLEIKSI